MTAEPFGIGVAMNHVTSRSPTHAGPGSAEGASIGLTIGKALEISDDPAAVVARVQGCHEGLCRRLEIHHE